MKENVKLPFLDDVAPLEAFDPKAFIDADPQVQKVCDFVLALALIFNDYKDLWWAGYALGKNAPNFNDNFHETPAWGHYTGLDNHIHRLQASVLIELARQLDESTKTIQRPLFQEILKKLGKIDQEAWSKLTNPDSDLRKHLKNVRDKISFHYYYSENGDQKVIPDGYRAAFKDTGRRPFISWGKTILDTRFYFADAAALDMERLIRPADWKEKFDEHTKQVTRVLSAIVLIFLDLRGCSPKKI